MDGGTADSQAGRWVVCRVGRYAGGTGMRWFEAVMSVQSPVRLHVRAAIAVVAAPFAGASGTIAARTASLFRCDNAVHCNGSIAR